MGQQRAGTRQHALCAHLLADHCSCRVSCSSAACVPSTALALQGLGSLHAAKEHARLQPAHCHRQGRLCMVGLHCAVAATHLCRAGTRCCLVLMSCCALLGCHRLHHHSCRLVCCFSDCCCLLLTGSVCGALPWPPLLSQSHSSPTWQAQQYQTHCAGTHTMAKHMLL